MVICRDKKEFDYSCAKKKLERSLKSDISRKLVEWPYRNIERRILAETFLGDDLTDYKFYCFDGEVDVVLNCIGSLSFGNLGGAVDRLSRRGLVDALSSKQGIQSIDLHNCTSLKQSCYRGRSRER